jgi:hypothetical protein
VSGIVRRLGRKFWACVSNEAPSLAKIACQSSKVSSTGNAIVIHALELEWAEKSGRLLELYTPKTALEV